MAAITLISRRLAIQLLIVGTIILAVVSCTPRVPDDGYAFLARYKDEWQRGAPRPISAAPFADSTPADPAERTSQGARAPAMVVFLDAGHGGVDTGTIGTTADGQTIEEKTIVLAIALRTANHLRADGLTVVLSRTDDSLPGSTPADYTSDGKMLTPDGVLADLQRRIDRANASGARVLLSIHLNGFSDPAVGGSETFYDAARPFAAQNKQFATLVQDSVIAALRANGYSTPDRGVTNDQDLTAESLGSLDSSYRHLVLLGPAVPGRLRASQMPGALSEPLFLSNPTEATAVSQPAVQEILAVAYARAIEAFLQTKPP